MRRHNDRPGMRQGRRQMQTRASSQGFPGPGEIDLIGVRFDGSGRARAGAHRRHCGRLAWPRPWQGALARPLMSSCHHRFQTVAALVS